MKTENWPKRDKVTWHPFERQIWLEKVNRHMENKLAKANRDKDFLRHMKTHYWARTHVCRARMKILKAKLRKALKRRKRPDPLQILAEASLAEHETWWETFTPNFSKFGENFVILNFFWSQNRFFRPMCCATWRALMIGTSSGGKFDIFWVFYGKLCMLRNGWEISSSSGWS